MTYQEKQSLVSLFSSLLVTTGAILFVYLRFLRINPERLSDYRFWGKTMLWFMLVSIVIRIVIYILFHIINNIATGEEDPITDERDRQIELRAMRVSHWIFVLGFILSLFILAGGGAPFIMILTMAAAGWISDITDESIKFLLYRRGF